MSNNDRWCSITALLLLSSSLWDNKFTEEGKANLQKAAEERKRYTDFVGLDLRCDSQYCAIYRSVQHIRPPLRISSPYIFCQSSCTGILISQIGPPTMAMLPKKVWSSSIFASGVNATAHWKDPWSAWKMPPSMLGPNSVNVDHRVSGGREKRRQISVELCNMCSYINI